jgi:hypothetical protein
VIDKSFTLRAQTGLFSFGFGQYTEASRLEMNPKFLEKYFNSNDFISLTKYFYQKSTRISASS